MKIAGFDELQKTFAELKDVPEEVLDKSLTAMAETALPQIKAEGERMGVRDDESTKHILDILKAKKFEPTTTGGHVDITFPGTRTRGNKETRNNEIAFVNEYGKKNQPARPFIKNALEKNGEKIVEAGADVIHDWMEKTFEK